MGGVSVNAMLSTLLGPEADRGDASRLGQGGGGGGGVPVSAQVPVS